MSPREVIERLRYKAVVEIERRRHRRGTLAPADRLVRALREDLRGPGWSERLLAARESTTTRFFAATHQRDRMRELFETSYRLERDASIRQAEMVREGQFAFFGQQFACRPDIEWQADPVSRRRWPNVYHADVPIHAGDVGYGDVKYVWELSRQQYLIDLAKAHFLTGSDSDLEALQRFVRSWIRGNPYATGVNWSCALEPAFRTWSWLWAYHLSSNLDASFHLEWLSGFYDHGRFLATHLEHYSSPYNHLIGEASALFAIGVCFPEFANSEKWRRRALSVLEGRLREQFYRDGGSVEQSTFYHHATTGFYLLAALLARANQQELSIEIWRAVERAIEFSTQLMQPDGTTPEIGGEDDGKPIRLESRRLWDFRAYQATGAVLFSRADFKAAADRFPEDALWLLGPDGLNRFLALEPATPSHTALLAVSGYAVDRSAWSEDADYVCFDVGEQAAGMRPDGVPNSMHGHADCLSIIVWLGGRRVLVDSGLYAYNCGGVWESHFRETAAHNTARIDGRDQARHIGKMAWSHSYRVTIEGHWSDDRQCWTIASHDGYARGTNGVTHRRTVWRRPQGYILIYDEFVGQGEHDVEVNFQFAPGRLEVLDAGLAMFEGFADVLWVGSGDWTAVSRCGGAQPQDGWISSSLGVRQPAPRLTIRTRTRATKTALLTILADKARVSLRTSVQGETLSNVVASTGESQMDVITAAGITREDRSETGEMLAVRRIGAGGEIERFSVAAQSAGMDENTGSSTDATARVAAR